MSKFPILIILGLVILIGGAFYIFSAQRKLEPETVFPSPSPAASITPDETPSIPNELGAGGDSYLDSTGLYNFLYPNDFILDEQDKAHIRIYKTGPTQKGQTEMYDGALMVFEAINLGSQNLRQWTDDYIKTSTADGTSEVIEAKKDFSVNGYPGFEFKLRGLGESQYYILQRDASSKNAVLIVTAVYDPTNAGFQKQVDSTLATLKLLK